MPWKFFLSYFFLYVRLRMAYYVFLSCSFPSVSEKAKNLGIFLIKAIFNILFVHFLLLQLSVIQGVSL